MFQIGNWRSLVAHLLWEQGVVGSNPIFPTALKERRKRRAIVQTQSDLAAHRIRLGDGAESMKLLRDGAVR